MSAELPLFPLGTVLFPDGPLPLRIFETRYTDMVSRCMRQGSPFGVVQILRGAEAGALNDIATVGCSARIVDFDKLSDGLLGIRCLGEKRLRIVRHWQADDGLNLGEIDWIDTEPVIAVPAEFAHLAAILQKVWPELGERYAAIEPHFDDASWLGYRLAELLPIEAELRQRCLELTDPLQRLAQLAPRVRRA